MKRILLPALAVALAATTAPAVAVDAGAPRTARAAATDEAAAGKRNAFPRIGPLTGPAGKKGFRFGVASSATQIEDRNPNTDWYKWTAPAPEGMGKSPFVGEGVKGYTKALEDVRLIDDLNVDAYRFGVEWARIEPKRNVIDRAALDHYRKQLDALAARGIRPMITVHHFANPVWVDDPADNACANGPGDANLCGLDHPQGGPLVVKEMAEFAGLLARAFGDRVDEWVTVNEPMVYMTLSHSFGAGPPGKASLLQGDVPRFTAAQRTYVQAHVAMYEAIKAGDQVDADRDGAASSVGLTTGAQEYVPVRNGRLSDDPKDVAARDRYRQFVDYSVVDSLWQGKFDKDLDGTMDEAHPEWKGKLDWLGPQSYSRTGVSAPGGDPAGILYPVLNVEVCLAAPSLPLLDSTYFVPTMGYETNPQGLSTVLREFGERYPGLPLVVTESGMATESGTRRAEHLVRALDEIQRVRAEGVDVRGYYHWSLMDNFEWLGGYTPRFGLYRVDRSTMERTPTEAATVYARIAAQRAVSPADRARYGGTGPLTPEPPAPPAGP
ncbi:glycoside hydrolase family 1 protein [Streptomyces sp. NPDC012888]|uniref:glycoside hydrolase family 1 protein n=1 Tax=Streptomyces sp. NPDC012888 TaxID=3364855 RepID=UPI003699400B